MIYSKNGLKLTDQFEGCRLTAYQDVKGVLTIGYGHTLDVYEGMTITKDQAEQYLSDDIMWAEKTVNQYIKVPLTQDEFDALVDFVFNVGSGNFVKSTLLKLLNHNDLIGAAHELELWDHAGDKVVSGLLIRRKKEEALFLG
jgi:lysozyme